MTTKHGMSNTRFYRTWRAMVWRCNHPSGRQYYEKGIKVERTTFEDFYSDMYASYKILSDEIGEQHVSIERKDNDKNYCKSNCERIHINKQYLNKSTNKYYTHNGITDSLTGWGKTLGLSRLTLFMRIKAGRSIEEALSTTKQGAFGYDKMIIKHEGKDYTVRQLAPILGVSTDTIYRKIREGKLLTKQ